MIPPAEAAGKAEKQSEITPETCVTRIPQQNAGTAPQPAANPGTGRPRPVLPGKLRADAPAYGPKPSIPSYLPKSATTVGVGADVGKINVKKSIAMGGRGAEDSYGIPSRAVQQAQIAADPSRKPAAVIRRKGTGSGFADLPPTEKLRPMGHAKADWAVRWIDRQADGLYLQSRYGMTRISPMGGGILRISFARGQSLEDIRLPQIAAQRIESRFLFRENAAAAELAAPEAGVKIDKRTGVMTFLGADRKPLLTEKAQEPRLLEINSGQMCAWQYFDWAKNEQLYALGGQKESGLALRGQARYISAKGELPFFLSDKGYGILIASENPVICCDLPAYGSFLCVEHTRQMDYYFIAGKTQNTVLAAYGYLLGKQ